MRLTGVETDTERLEKEADTATADDGYTRSRNCGEESRHGDHLWPELVAGLTLTRKCWGNIVVARPPRARGEVTREDEDLWDGGLSSYDFDDEGGEKFR